MIRGLLKNGSPFYIIKTKIVKLGKNPDIILDNGQRRDPMKKPNKRGVTAASIIVGLTAASAMMLTNCNFNGTVYGPPPTSDTDDTWSTRQTP